MVVFFSFIIIVNILTFHLYRIDKQQAEASLSRIPEAILLALSFLGGALGAFCAMQEYRHKTLHKSFSICVPIALVLQAALVIWAMVYCIIHL